MTTSNARSIRHRPVLVPCVDRVRTLNGVTFGWIDARLWRAGWLEVLSPEAIAVYLFLCLVAERRGVSFYRRDRIGKALGLDVTDIARALSRLVHLGLVAFQPFGPNEVDGYHQVLPVPDGGPPAFAASLVDG